MFLAPSAPKNLRWRYVWFGACAALALGFPSLGRAEAVEVRYGVTIMGLPVGQADLQADVNADRYKVDVQAKLVGLVRLFSGGKGNATASGLIATPTPRPSGYAVTSSNGKDERTVRMILGGGAVTGLDVDPPFDEKVDRIPVTDAHKRGVMDPVSALIMPALNKNDMLARENCERTLPIFDGLQRFDIVLNYSRMEQVKPKAGYTGPVLVCAVAYKPIAGYRPARKENQFMAQNKEMEVWLAPVASTHTLVPYRIKVRTMIGMADISAAYFMVESQNTKSAKSAKADTAR
jgi:Protein of unknown function (DUF3108)